MSQPQILRSLAPAETHQLDLSGRVAIQGADPFGLSPGMSIVVGGRTLQVPVSGAPLILTWSGRASITNNSANPLGYIVMDAANYNPWAPSSSEEFITLNAAPSQTTRVLRGLYSLQGGLFNFLGAGLIVGAEFVLGGRDFPLIFATADQVAIANTAGVETTFILRQLAGPDGRPLGC